MVRAAVPMTVCILAWLFLAIAPAAAEEVPLPLRFDNALVQKLLLEQVFSAPPGSLVATRDAHGCNYLILSDPALAGVGGLLRVRSTARGRVGTPIGSRCLVLLEWTGLVETDQRAELDARNARVRFRTVDSRLLDEDGAPAAFTGAIWGWVADFVHPRLDTLNVDLQMPLAEIRALLPLMMTSDDAARTRAMVDSLELDAVSVEPDAVTLFARIDVPPATGAAPAPVLSAEELARWQQAWQQWDAFLTFVIKASARDTASLQAREALLEVLLSARYDIVEALAAAPDGPDPVPALFVRTWDRLAPVLRELQTGLPGETALRYLGFIAAADALRGIERLGTGSGLDISAAGLRRMARIIAPSASEDPLTRSFEVDTELRSLMGLGAPIESPPPDGGARWIEYLVPAANAAVRVDPLLVVKLNLWVPDYKNASGYLPLAQELLDQTAELTLAKGKVPDMHAKLFRNLVLATAWKESCWRQFVRTGGEIKTLESVTGALGMMQVDPNAWRGFYDVSDLAQNIGYNARAGADILAHYLTHYALRKGEDKHGIRDALARATYAVYNGGPSHRRRYRMKSTKKSLRAIDASFYEKFLLIKAGETHKVMTCYLG